MARAPSLFVSHGSPMFAIEPGRLGLNLQKLGASLQRLTDCRGVVALEDADTAGHGHRSPCHHP
ncbi:hypothetical protein [Stenotrophomonas chelatiphaga]|uniref:hypothetical protein n=1 Tax=Stenotrophomonas chelatiphaga TaxID=517011 RepID=UPI00289B5F9D|nr:hypothetical protein [Stenotrophomonas chelatiphaga]